MRIRIWGSRGSIATSGAETAQYGGNTSCIQVTLDDGTLIILDAGTGARGLGLTLVDDPPSRIDLLLTHLHVDHVEGLGAFEPIWRPQTDLHIWGPASPMVSLEERIATYFSPPLFPIHLSEVPARCTFHDAPDREWMIGDAMLRSDPIQHPGATVGYRLEADGRVLTYLTDHEPALGMDLETSRPEWISGFALASGADMLIHDCQYTREEYETRFGFGHSSTDHVAAFAQKTEADRTVLFHHDPMHTDAELEAIREAVIERWGVEPERCVIAAEGSELVV